MIEVDRSYWLDDLCSLAPASKLVAVGTALDTQMPIQYGSLVTLLVLGGNTIRVENYLLSPFAEGCGKFNPWFLLKKSSLMRLADNEPMVTVLEPDSLLAQQLIGKGVGYAVNVYGCDGIERIALIHKVLS